jgi:hypothetical protein
MPKQKIRTTTFARVQVTVEVPAGSWGTGCELSQVYQQASESAIGTLRRLFVGQNVRIVGVAKVEAVTTNAEGSR